MDFHLLGENNPSVEKMMQSLIIQQLFPGCIFSAEALFVLK